MRTLNSTKNYRFIGLFPHETAARRLLKLQDQLCRAGCLSARALPVCRLWGTPTALTENQLRHLAGQLRDEIGPEIVLQDPQLVSQYSEAFPFPAIVLAGNLRLSNKLTKLNHSGPANNPKDTWLLAPITSNSDLKVTTSLVTAISQSAESLKQVGETSSGSYPIRWRAAYIANLIIKLKTDLTALRWERGFQAWLPAPDKTTRRPVQSKGQTPSYYDSLPQNN